VIDVPVVASRPEAERIVGRLSSHGLRAAVAANDSQDSTCSCNRMMSYAVAGSNQASPGWLIAAAGGTAGRARRAGPMRDRDCNTSSSAGGRACRGLIMSWKSSVPGADEFSRSRRSYQH